MDQKPGNVRCLGQARADLSVPTQVMSALAQMTGAGVTACRPGLVTVRLDNCGTTAEVRIRVADVCTNARSVYKKLGYPLPDHLKPGADDQE